MVNKYYIYFHINPLKNEVFYVGRGCGNRAYVKRNRNKYWNNTVNKYGYIIDLVEIELTWQESIDREVFYINKIGIDNLTNMTIGGEGSKGHIQETIQKMCIARRKRKSTPHTEETKKKMSLARRKRKKDTPEEKKEKTRQYYKDNKERILKRMKDKYKYKKI